MGLLDSLKSMMGGGKSEKVAAASTAERPKFRKRVDIRNSYPVKKKYLQRGSGAGNRKVKPAPFPTNALPGSLEKILVLTQRAALGQELWHPDDATVAGPTLRSQAG